MGKSKRNKLRLRSSTVLEVFKQRVKQRSAIAAPLHMNIKEENRSETPSDVSITSSYVPLLARNTAWLPLVVKTESALSQATRRRRLLWQSCNIRSEKMWICHEKLMPITRIWKIYMVTAERNHDNAADVQRSGNDVCYYCVVFFALVYLVQSSIIASCLDHLSLFIS